MAYDAWTEGYLKAKQSKANKFDPNISIRFERVVHNFTRYIAYPLSENSKKYLSQYIELSDKTVLAIGKHAMRYALHTDICAYYKDMEDFFSDWCSIGYSRTEARKLMHGGHGEFMKLPDGLGYIRFVI